MWDGFLIAVVSLYCIIRLNGLRDASLDSDDFQMGVWDDD